MATLSFGSLVDFDYPTLWDLDEMKKVQLADGATFDTMLTRISRAMSLLNRELLGLPLIGEMIAVQDNVEVEYPVGVTNGVEKATEFGIPAPKRGKTTGHSLPLEGYDRALGWTQMYLRKARTTKLNADVRSAVTDIKQHFAQNTLQRFFDSAAYKVGDTAGASVPLADGGVADSSYVPVDGPDGNSFDNTHNHYLRLSGISDANLNTALATLYEHGHKGPYELLTAQADAASWTALTGFAKPNWGGLIYRAAEDRAALDNIDKYIGYVETDYGIARVVSSFRIPTAYWGAYQSYGQGDPRNPVRMRIDPKLGFGWRIVPGNYVNAPQLLAIMYAEMGWGIGEDRTNGVCVYNFGSGSYVVPTIS